jgi:hypothetical protein
VLAGARGQGHGGVGGVAAPVVRVVHRPGEVPGVQRREQLDRLFRRDRLGGDPVGPRGRGLPEQFLQPFGAVGQVQRPGPLDPVAKPVSSSSVWKTRRLRRTISRVPYVGLAWVIRPAACQVVPEVSRLRSSSTTSVQPRLARWYAVLQPATPPPTMTTRALAGSACFTPAA